MQEKLFVIMPAFEDTKSVSALLPAIKKEFSEELYVIVVDDGSVENPASIDVIKTSGLRGEVLHLARNVGHQRAIAAGICYVSQNFEPNITFIMDSDGEDKPEEMPRLLTSLRDSKSDVVVAHRRRRSESFQFRAFYIFYKLIFKLLTGRTIRFGNFMALTGAAVRRLAAMQETWLHVAASVMVSKLRVSAVETDRGKRYFGASKMNFVALSLHGLRSIMVFAEDVLVRIGALCSLFAVGAVVLLIAAVLLKLVGIATPGWYSVASGILIVILLQAGILMFVTLMVSGVVKSSVPMGRTPLEQFIERIEKTE